MLWHSRRDHLALRGVSLAAIGADVFLLLYRYVGMVRWRWHAFMIALDVEIGDSHLYFAGIRLEVRGECRVAPIESSLGVS